MSKPRLKRCPFCDAPPRLIEVCKESMPVYGSSGWFVRCSACFVSTRVCDPRSDAIKAWNRRPKKETK